MSALAGEATCPWCETTFLTNTQEVADDLLRRHKRICPWRPKPEDE